jgi:hypothetical protein
MSTVATEPAPSPSLAPVQAQEITVYSRSSLFYWWPVWVVGYIRALTTYFGGAAVPFEDATVIMHPSKNLGVIYTVVFLLVLLMTNVTVRGLASIALISTLVALTFFFAYMGWWDVIFQAFANLAIYMNLGFYVFFSTAVLVVWALAFFVFDKMNYWTFRPGQLVHTSVYGGGSQSYDTRGMMVSKLRDDLFRHWVLGLGSGDLNIATTGAKREEFTLPNVLLIGSKVPRIQQLIAMQPDEHSDNIVTVGGPS